MKATKALSASLYTDADIFELERKRIFSREWVLAGHLSEIGKVGDYMTVDIAGYPIILLRKANGEVSAFHNVCPHRASPLLEEETGRIKGKAMTCPYHRWTFNLDGKLLSAPEFECVTEEDKCEYSLFDIKVEILLGMIFVNLDRDAKPFSETHAELKGIIKDYHGNPDGYVFNSKYTIECPFNWKVWVDNYQECYHCPTIHPAFNQDFYVPKYKVENHCLFSEHKVGRRGQSDSGNVDGLWLWVYPNLALPFWEPYFYSIVVNPLTVNRTLVTYTFHAKRDFDEQKLNAARKWLNILIDEDVKICEKVQKNLEAGIYEAGPLNDSRENGVIYFQNLVRASLGIEEKSTTSGGSSESERKSKVLAR